MITDYLIAIANKVAALKTAVGDAYAALRAKGAAMPQDETAANLATTIAGVPQGYTFDDYLAAGGKCGFTAAASLPQDADWSQAPDFQDMFRNCTGDVALTGGLPQGATYFRCFYNASGVTSIDWSGASGAPTSIENAFRGMTSLVSADLTGLDVSQCSVFSYCFYGDTALTTLDLTGWQMNDRLQFAAGSMFSQCSRLTSLIGDHTLAEVEAGTVALYINTNSFASTDLQRASLLAVIKGLPDLSGTGGKTLQLGSTLTARLTADDIAIATNKNWTIS